MSEKDSHLLISSLIELLMLVSHFTMIYDEKYSKVFLWNAWNILTRMQRRKNDRLYTSRVGTIKISTRAKLLDIVHKPFGFNSDIIEAIN